MTKRIKVVHIALAVPEDSDNYHDMLSDLRDSSNGEILEWAVADKDMPEQTGYASQFAELFESCRGTPDDPRYQ